MVWILITTFMVVVGTGHCIDGSVSHLDPLSPSECQFSKAETIHVESSVKSHNYSNDFSPLDLTTPAFFQSEVYSAEGLDLSHALGSSLLADKRFSGTSPPPSVAF